MLATSDGIVVLDIGGTTTRAARIMHDRVESVMQCPTPTAAMSPDVSPRVVQHQLVDLVADLVESVTNDLSSGFAETPLRVAIAISADVQTSSSFADEVSSRLAGTVQVRVCSDLDAARARYLRRASTNNFAILMVRTGVHSTHGIDAAAASAGGAGALNTLIASCLQNPKAFRSSDVFRHVAQRSAPLRFEQRLALLRRSAVLQNADLIDVDVWRDMRDKQAELTPAEQQRWMLPALLDCGMLIDAVRTRDPFALSLLDQIAEPVAQYVRQNLAPQVEVVALGGGFARALGEAYRSRISPPAKPSLVQWAEDDDLGDLLATKSYLWPDEVVIDLRHGTSLRLADAEA